MADRETLVDVLPTDEDHAHAAAAASALGVADESDAAAAVVVVDDATGRDEDTDGGAPLGIDSAHEDPSDQHHEQHQQQRILRGRYAKFTANMDVVMLEAMRVHNPFTAKHGTRLQMWQMVAETVGEAILKNSDAYSWHTCRDRVTTLMKLYADGKHDKLFKHGTVEENTRKEAILREFHQLLHRKGSKPGSVVRAPTVLEASVANAPMLFQAANGGGGGLSGVSAATLTGGVGAATAREARASNARAGGHAAQKRRRLDANANAYTAARSVDAAQLLDGDTFRARVLELMEAKIQFDMEQRVKENELREQEFELQKRFLEYLQTK